MDGICSQNTADRINNLRFNRIHVSLHELSSSLYCVRVMRAHFCSSSKLRDWNGKIHRTNGYVWEISPKLVTLAVLGVNSFSFIMAFKGWKTLVLLFIMYHNDTI